MADTDRFQPGDQIEFICHDEDPAAPTGGWVPGTFQRYFPWQAGHAGGPADMKALVIPRGHGEAAALSVPIGELRFPPPAPGPLTPLPPFRELGDVMPAVVNGMLVVSAFRIEPDVGSDDLTWRVILRDHEGEQVNFAEAIPTYTVTRVCWIAAAPGIADGEWQDVDVDVNEWFRGLTRKTAGVTFARMIKLDAAPRDED